MTEDNDITEQTQAQRPRKPKGNKNKLIGNMMIVWGGGVILVYLALVMLYVAGQNTLTLKEYYGFKSYFSGIILAPILSAIALVVTGGAAKRNGVKWWHPILIIASISFSLWPVFRVFLMLAGYAGGMY